MMDIAVLSTAALAAGVLNALAGGGSFLTFPALVFTGVPAIAANATSAVAVAPGYLGSTLGFKAELAALPRRRLWVEGAICAAGGALGAALLLNTPARVFSAVVPWLLLFATACFALGPRWLAARQARRPQVDAPSTSRLGQRAGLLLVAVYGGYFNGGLGILLMALYSVTGERDIHTSNALKNLNSWVLSLLSVATFAAAGLVQWPQAALMMVATTAGGFWGARLARRWPPAVVRAIVITTGLVMAGVFFARQ
ncbi:MAG: hypothetical protein CFE46_15285 [Burkholderiales bacterium PBB6]|nr:MAG: hypothetical protein CFE46_15285 [Burkholderiales bacterium PBB6]